jgi:hypothetical protein
MEFNLPLELWLKRAARTTTKFPVHSQNYFTLYCTLKEKLNINVYATVNAGLLRQFATDDATVPGVSIYTDHGLAHVNAVIRMAGDMLGCEKATSGLSLNPYEVYLLLCCIVCHDAGNIFGRDDHQVNVRRVLIDPLNSVLGEEDVRAIHSIAKTHTGKQLVNGAYTKDTIQVLETNAKLLFQTEYRPRIIAAVLRLADEMSEDRRRVPQMLLADPAVRDGGSGIYLTYASTISNSSVDRKGRSLRIDYELSEDQVLKECTKFEPVKVDGKIGNYAEKTVYLLDEIVDRLKKVNRERVYCNRYAEGVFTFSRLTASLTVVVAGENQDVSERVLQKIEMFDVGYPGEETSSSSDFSIWNAKKVHQEIVDSKRGTP